MNKKALAFFLLLILIIAFISFGFRKSDSNNILQKVTTNDNYKYIAINQILMWVSNNGDGSHDPGTDGNGFYWPGGVNATKSAIFEDGLIWGCKIGRETRVNGNTHRQGLQAGKILPDGTADDPSLSKYRVYKIRKGWENLPPSSERDDYERDYNEWPVEDGAPWVDIDGDGIFTRGTDEPEFVGDEVLWYVANDLDEARATFTYGMPSIGLEFQTTIFGFNRSGDLGDIVFKKYLIINKGQNTCKDMVLGYWSDTDLGDAGDDYTGCDTVLSLGYTYNGTNSDGIYGTPPPAVGYDFFQGPMVEGSPTDSAKFLGKWIHGKKDLGLTAFTVYLNGHPPYNDPAQGQPRGSIEFYRYLTGYLWNGEPFTDPNTQEDVKFVVAGDPVEGTGWYEGPGWPGGPPPKDRRHVMASGPFELAPGDSQEVVIGIVIAVGQDNIDSITELKRKDKSAQIAYDLNFQLTPSPPSPELTGVARDKSITLYWESNAESYDEGDPLLYGQKDSTGAPLADTTYTFQGYQIWQYKDLAGTDPKLLKIYDVADSIATIWDIRVINGINVLVPVIVGPDEGVRHSLTIVDDKYGNKPLCNGNPYYFSVTAYGYSPNSSPTYLENPPVIIEVKPETQKIDLSYTHDLGDKILADHISGDASGKLELKIVDPDALTGHEYRAYIHGAADSLSYTFVDVTDNDTILAEDTYFSDDTVSTEVYDGFMILMQDVGQDTINSLPGSQKYGLKEVLEIKGPNGQVLDQPVKVLGNLNSTGEWKVLGYGANADQRLNIDWQDAIGFDNYEIRFTSSGSEYYATGFAYSFTPQTKSDPKGKGTVPFEIWNVGRDLESDADDFRLTIKVQDCLRTDTLAVVTDTAFTQLENGNWEAIYAYFSDSTYQEPLPETSGKSEITDHKLGAIIFNGDLPHEGTVIRFNTWRPLVEGNVYSIVATAPNIADNKQAKNSLDDISVFPNPYFGFNRLERDKYQRFVRFTNLPTNVTVRIYSIAGVFIQRIDKNDPTTQWLDWNLCNKDGMPVASGIYIAHLDMPGIGSKVLKIAVIKEQQFIDRL